MTVTINRSLTNSGRGTVYSAARTATETKLGYALPGNFDHVMFVLEDCYQDCGWAGEIVVCTLLCVVVRFPLLCIVWMILTVLLPSV